MSNLPSQAAQMLDPVDRLALAYTPASARSAWQALIFFKQRLVETAKPGREPLMIQLRLSWWRDRLSEPSDRLPVGEPLLALLKVWEAEATALVALVDGWEAKIVGEDGGVELQRAEIDAYVALARLLGESAIDDVCIVAQQAVTPRQHQGRLPKLSRAMRPLAIQAALAQRKARRAEPTPIRDLAMLVRVGLLGR